MDLGISGKKAFIGASSKGLGKAVALELASAGVDVAINGRNKESLEKARAEILEIGSGECLIIQGDLSIKSDREKVLNQLVHKWNGVDILVTNTGGPPSGSFHDFEKEDWDQAYELLLASAVELIKGLMPKMKERNWGRIIAITSQAIRQPVENLILSNAVRLSLAGLLKSLASELGPFNITVNNVMPGYTETERLTSLIDKNPSYKKAKEHIPLRRFGKPEEFAAAVAFLASKRASFITGASLPVDGGAIKSVL